MHLKEKPFDAIKCGEKDVEIRLNDPKRKKLKVGDQVEFTNEETGEKLIVEVEGLHPFETFEHLYEGLDSKYIKKFRKDHFIIACHTIYSKEKEEKHGALGIEIKLHGDESL